MILSTLDIKFFKHLSLIYLIISFICALFSFCYELFSHHVYSNFMIFTFTIPLVFGSLISFLIYQINPSKIPDKLTIDLYNTSIATFTTYSLIKGVLEIYGTTNFLTNIYLIAGSILLTLSLTSYILTPKINY